mgnify:FL=1
MFNLMTDSVIVGPDEPEYQILGYKLYRTCHACPQQYDVLDQNNKQIAYYRLRHGRFYAACPDYGGEVVYDANPKGDGIFDEDEEEMYLVAATMAVDRWVNRIIAE